MQSFKTYHARRLDMAIEPSANYGNHPVGAPKVLPPSIIPVVILRGSDYEMGYQYGQQVGQYIEMKKGALWVSVFEMLSYAEALHELKAFQYYIKEYAPEQVHQNH